MGTRATFDVSKIKGIKKKPIKLKLPPDPETDLRLEPENHQIVVSGGAVVKVAAHDLLLDSPPRRGPLAAEQKGLRRALVHDFQDGLTINWARDYPGGVSIYGKVTMPDGLSVQNMDVYGKLQDLASQIQALQAKVAALEKKA